MQQRRNVVQQHATTLAVVLENGLLMFGERRLHVCRRCRAGYDVSILPVSAELLRAIAHSHDEALKQVWPVDVCCVTDHGIRERF